MGRQLEQLGFTPTHRHPTKNVTRYKQGRINLMVNRDADGRVAAFRASMARPPARWRSVLPIPLARWRGRSIMARSGRRRTIP